MTAVKNLGIVAFIIIGVAIVSTSWTDEVETGFKWGQIVPDVITTPPSGFLKVTYENNNNVYLGTELTPTQVKCQPSIEWIPSPGAYYTLIMFDPDVPSRSEPTMRSVIHWMVGNIPADDICQGEVLAAYFGSGPDLDTGRHRYVFLLYEQPGKLNFDEPRIPNNSVVGRLNFNVAEFAQKYGLNDPIAGNYYLAQWDEYVPIVHAQVGIP